MKKILFIAIFILPFLLLFHPSMAEAANWYVRTDGNDACNGTVDAAGSSGNCAKKTIQAGVNLAYEGDTVIVHAGTYTSSNPIYTSARAGSDGSLITIQAADGEAVSITRAVINHNYNVVKGFTVLNSGNYYNGGVHVTASYNQVLNNTFYGTCEAQIGDCNAVVLLGGSYNIVSNNIIDGLDNGRYTSFQRAFYANGNYNEIIHNTIQDTAAIERVFEVYGNGTRIAYNEVKNILRSGNTVSHPDLFQFFGPGNSYNIIVENNYLHDFDGQIGNMTTTGGTKSWTWRNNVFANVSAEIFLNNMTANWYNNTFYRCSYATGRTGFPLYGAYAGTVLNVKNNAFIACGTDVTNGWYSGGSGTKDYNFVSHTATGGTKTGFSEIHGVNGGNPQLTAYFNDCATNTCNFHVGATSALLNVGDIIAGLSTDKDGVSRPQGSAWDIGAYEYLSSAPPPPIAASTYEAESCVLASPMQIVSDTAASGGQYIQTSASESGTATCSFSISQADTYKITARVFAPNGGTDSFYFQIDNSPEDTYDLNPTASPSEYNVWREDDLTKRGTGTFDNPQYDPYTINLSSGAHTLALRGRESNARLDYFYLTRVADTTPPSAPINLMVN